MLTLFSCPQFSTLQLTGQQSRNEASFERHIAIDGVHKSVNVSSQYLYQSKQAIYMLLQFLAN